ncbi:hypothetical protein D3C72_1319450 [compost metagenome]
MDHMGDLHRGAVVVQARDDHVEHPAGGREDQPEQHHPAPEPHLLAGVEARAGHVGARDEPAELAHPDHIPAVRHVVTHEHHEGGDDRQREHRPGQVVQVLENVGEPAEQRVAHDRQQEVLAEQDHDARDRQDHEGDGHGPVHEALGGRKALDHPARARGLQRNGAAPGEEGQDGRRRQDQDPAAPDRQHAIAEQPPLLAGALDQDAGFLVGQAAVVVLVGVDFAPDRRVVARLGHRALLLRAGLGGHVAPGDVEDVLAGHARERLHRVRGGIVGVRLGLRRGLRRGWRRRRRGRRLGQRRARDTGGKDHPGQQGVEGLDEGHGASPAHWVRLYSFWYWLR